MLWVATEDDVPRLAELGEEFYNATIYARSIPYDKASARETLTNILRSDLGIILVYGDIRGFIAGIAAPVYANRTFLQAHELFWWVSPEFRGGRSGVVLLRAFERWAESIGASVVAMSSLETLAPERVARMYDKAGYSPSEHLFIKVLD